MVSEDGASIYSASKIARDEFPDCLLYTSSYTQAYWNAGNEEVSKYYSPCYYAAFTTSAFDGYVGPVSYTHLMPSQANAAEIASPVVNPVKAAAPVSLASTEDVYKRQRIC